MSELKTESIFIPLSIPEIQGNEWKYVKDCLDTGWVSSVGEYVGRFERMIANAVEAPFSVATSSGTSALHVALVVSGVEPDDEVLVSTLTFIAPVNTIRYVGAWPVLIDAEPEYWQIDTQKLTNFLRNNCEFSRGELHNHKTGRRVKAILPVHILGHPSDMDPILAIAREFGLIVIEDATECLGAKYKGKHTGTIGDIACFSFNGNKIITTGGGGAIVTSNPEWASRAKYLTTQAKDDPIEYVHKEIGYNYRLTNLQAALGCAQIERLEHHIATKRRIAERYRNGLRGLPGIVPMPAASWAESIFWLYTVLVNEEHFGMDARCLIKELGARSIQTRPLWQPMHRSPVHCRSEASSCEIADRLYSQAVSLPCSVGLTESDQEYVIASVVRLAEARRGKSA